MQDIHDLSVILDCRIPIIVLESHEEPKAIDLFMRVARKRNKPVFQWTLTDGLQKVSFGLQLVKDTQHSEPEEVLQRIKGGAEPGFYVLCDFHHWLDEHPKNIRLLKDIAQKNTSGEITVVLLSHALDLPPELSRLSARFKMSLPNDKQILSIIREEAKQWGQLNGNQKVTTDNETLQKLVSNLKGLPRGDICHLVRGAIVDDGAITASDIPEVNQAKFKLMELEGILSYEYDTKQFAAVGGMENLKKWLGIRRGAFNNNSTVNSSGNGGGVAKIDAPKGILLLGVQGGGKSLAAKSVAGMWNVPLLRLDIGALYNKFHGETERNLRESLAMAEKMSPCVLWMDEIEKGLSTDNSDSGTSQRVLGTLLTWLSEKRSPVFVVATSNDISKLPPELIRKGRLDELFFVDLPDEKTREIIFKIHLEKRELDANNFDLAELSLVAEGFTGAEIEQAIVSAVYRGLSENGNGEADKLSDNQGQQRVVSQSLLLAELQATAPLSIVMAEKLAALRQWADERNMVRV
jgi:SpoVK/Ycf46/Vps4 family AAA+-type ATPase